MSDNSMWSFGHLEYLNMSIINAMGHCSRIRKSVTENREQIENREQRTEKPITGATLIANGLLG